jgi:transcriptional regulator with XRE-family HTH domain
MDTAINDKPLHIGKKIERVRKLRGLTQDEVAKGLGITKQAVSKIEQSENIEEERLKQVADVLGVTLDGLKSFRDETVLYTANFYEGSNVSNSLINTRDCTQINNPIEKIIELYETLLKVEREKVAILQNKKVDQ